jgi:hypothetical protein
MAPIMIFTACAFGKYDAPGGLGMEHGGCEGGSVPWVGSTLAGRGGHILSLCQEPPVASRRHERWRRPWAVGVVGVDYLRPSVEGGRWDRCLRGSRGVGCIETPLCSVATRLSGAGRGHATTLTSTLTRFCMHASSMACQPSLRPPLAGDVAYGCTTPSPPTSTQRAQPAANAQGHKLQLP